MALVSLRCPSCGADIELDEKREFGFCSYCGTKVMMDKQIVELKGTIKVDGVSTADKLLERAFILVEDKEYSEAEGYFNKVLELEPKCAKAYWGKMLCEYRIPYAKTAEIKGIDITKSNNYKRAVSFATGKEKEKYITYGEKAAGTYGINEQEAIYEKKKKKTILLISKIVFAVMPFFVFGIYMSGTDTTDGTLQRVFIWIFSVIWIISYYVRKKLKAQLSSSANKKGNAIIWCVLGGLLVVCSMFMPFATTVPADEASSSDTATSAVVTTTEPTTEAPIEISASKLMKAYEDNEISANNNYKNKKIRLTGYVDNVSQSESLFSESYYVYVYNGEKYSYDYIRCSLSETSLEKAAELKPGDKIVIEGVCNGVSVTTISMSNCEIVN